MVTSASAVASSRTRRDDPRPACRGRPRRGARRAAASVHGGPLSGAAFHDQTLALAGIFQAAVLIDDIAILGSCNTASFDGSFDSLFTFDAPSAIDVFGSLTSLHRGFEALDDYLGGQGKPSSNNIAY